MSSMTYKGYAARIDYSSEDDCFVGHIIGINDIVGFHAATVPDLHVAFKKAVTGYLAACDKFDRKPQKPYSGNLGARVSPAVHAKAAMAAEIAGKSFNKFVGTALEAAADQVIKSDLEINSHVEEPGLAYAVGGRGAGKGAAVMAGKKKTKRGKGGGKSRPR